MFSQKKEQFITGNEAVVQGALAAGASFFSGYPITPATEILEGWADAVAYQEISARSAKNPHNQCLRFMQAEDETSAGFNVIGAILAGSRAFTATAGPGNILMQDPIAMAEAMRLPFVGVIMQRGGPSTGTVIYGQQELTMTAFGGNGEGLRIVYSTNSPQELYNYTRKSFDVAWRYRFPTFVLGDGYQAKEKSRVRVLSKSKIMSFLRQSAFKSASVSVPIGNMRNCYNFETELNKVLVSDINDFKRVAPKIVEYEKYLCRDAEIIIFAHGIVSLAAKEAVDLLRKNGKKVGLFRPITINPFPQAVASDLASSARKILIVESSNGHFSRVVKSNLYGLCKIKELLKPVMSISAQEIMEKIR